MIEPCEEVKRVEQRYEKALDDMEKRYKDMLDKIRTEIEERKLNSGGEPNRELAFNVCLKIIDKYTAEKEDV